MTNSVTFPTSLGGDGSTVTDDDNATTGLGNGGHRTRFVPAMGQVVAVANVLTQRITANSDTSSSSVAIGTGNKTFTTAGFYVWAVGMWVTVTSGANPANYMFGQVTSYNTSTKALVVDVDSVGGSGTLSDWTIALSAFNPTGTYLTTADIGTTVQAYDADLTTWAGKTAPTGTVVGTSDTQTLSNKTITGTKETVYTITDGAGFEINPANGGIQSITLGASRTPAATNFTAGQSVTLMINDGSAYTITWTSVAVTWVGGTAPTLATSGYTVIELWKVGSTIYGALVGTA
jgi:hypothetical protein